ncbi:MULTISPECIES: hypothetical protein [Anaerolinea]|uniref:Uncharacterized protein n=1 Tax=Anaerolinea thermophila (strain DSM 14523 / JCM 11388 / NBRC 100420 / UNI-1) TaxID=926569 RepID=E8MYB0_ANATU|nr:MULTISPECIES: hypothetical protein [Anaerolinea]BAJ62055.1 hypothetical protein ANT_00210 [Anaerolinea thermophila UNI-1]
MAKRVWQTIKVQYCRHVGREVSLEAEVIYPDEHLPDEKPRIVAHRCSRGAECGLLSEAACIWAGTNPDVDPFAEKPDTPETK